MRDINAYTVFSYELTRKGKMYLKNDRTLILDVGDLWSYLMGIRLQSFHMRFFYTRYTNDKKSDLKTNYPEKLLQASLTYALVRNIPLNINNIYSDANTFIFDLICQSDNITLKETMKDILTHESCSFVSKVEIKVDTNEGTLNFCLEGYRKNKYPESLFSPSETVDILGALPLESPVTLEVLDDYYTILEKNYQAFYEDVKKRYCTIWCWREGRGEYVIKRQIQGELVRFPPTFEEAEPLLQIERIVSIVPNSLPEDAEYPIELIIDIDVPKSVNYEITKRITDQFEEWLVDKGLFFKRRLTGSKRGGQHFIIPINLKFPFILAGKDETWKVYSKRAPRHILSDSARCIGEVVSLAFQKENGQLAPFITTRIFNPYIRYKRLLFDVSPNSMNRGRRALLSLHQSSLNVCIPYTGELPKKQRELEDLMMLETILTSKEPVTETRITSFMQEHNTQVLHHIIQQYERLFQEYYTSPAARFEELHLNIPIGGLDGISV